LFEDDSKRVAQTVLHGASCSCFFFVVVSEQPLLGVSVEQSAIFKKLFGDQIQTAFFHVI
jgi:hypothetical protein